MEVFRPYGFDRTLFFTTLALIAIGLIMVFSSSAILSNEKYNQPFHFMINQLIAAGMGIALIFFILPIRKPFYENAYFIYVLLIITFVLLALCIIMPAFGKINRSVQFLSLRFQPAELAKISLVLFFSFYIQQNKDRLNEIKTLLFPLGILFLAIFMIIRQPDYGTALLVFLICAVILFIGGVSLKYFLYTGILSIAIFTFYLFKASYRLDRIFAFLSPSKDSLGAGFQIIQSKLAVGSGGLLGVSLGESTQKLFFLPCVHTDYIYAIVGEELGLVGALIILIIFFIFLWRGLVISRRATNLFSQVAAAGITLAIFSQALLNISVVLGLGPPTGFPLPFISFGRSSLISTLFGIGILLHISQRKSTSRRKK
ncbi:MAG: cell division protein FtsW [Candidatus Aminicenantes bacterium]|nr:MAG: cell division protein FtsW [Candidatus Aminicenantes bacterium]